MTVSNSGVLLTCNHLSLLKDICASPLAPKKIYSYQVDGHGIYFLLILVLGYYRTIFMAGKLRLALHLRAPHLKSPVPPIMLV